jgi:hypothetical protein
LLWRWRIISTLLRWRRRCIITLRCISIIAVVLRCVRHFSLIEKIKKEERKGKGRRSTKRNFFV